MTEDHELTIRLRTHLGIAQTAKLVGFARMIAPAFPTSEVVVFGSVLHHKGWRDIDIAIVVTDEEYARLSTTTVDQLGGWFDITAAAYSALAREMTGLPVEVRVMGDSWPMTGLRLTLAGGLLS